MTTRFRFTGWHMLATMIAFFGVIIAVNVTMATLATRTFGGVVVENSYVASQEFNGWLKEARAQERLGWKARASTADRHAVIDAGALTGATVTATARHPLGRLPNVDLRFTETAPGHYVAQSPLPAGRWRLHLSIAHGKERADFVKDVTA
ncbi:FixH family protein [Sphingomonas sp. CJ20]